MTRHLTPWLQRCAAGLPGVVLAAQPCTAVSPPEGFGIHHRGTPVQVVHARTTGALPNPVDRQAIDAQCEMARRLGLTTAHPVFEPGHDQPLKTETWRFGQPHRSADFTALHAYECGRATAARDSAEAVCDCTYRVHIRLRARLRKQEGGQIETVDVDYTKGTAMRHRTADRSPSDRDADSDTDAARIRRLAPQVLGRDTIAGIACVWRRQQLAADAWIDHCIVDDPRWALPAELHARALGQTWFTHGGQTTHSWSKAMVVHLDATVDAGVFELPDGVQVREARP